MLHGQVTIHSGSGYKTLDVQTGTVTGKVCSTSITVKSSDGYIQTYTVTSSTLVNSQAAGIGCVVRMAANVAAAGFELTVWNRTEATAREFCDQHSGVKLASSPARAASDSDFVLTMW